MGYTRDAVRGVSWIVVLRIFMRTLSFFKTIILARILTPSQFGVYGIALIVLGFLEIMTETGVNVILVQEKETDKFINSAWFVSIVRGIIISLVIIICAPYIAVFFNSPDSILLLYAISIVPFIRGFINPSVVKFQKQLDFNKEFYYRSVVFALDSIAGVLFTVVLKNPIGIIYGLIAGAIIETLLSYLIVKPVPRLSLNTEYIKLIFNRGKWITSGGIMSYLFQNTDKMIIGRFLGTAPLGAYQIGYSLAILPITEIADVFSRVTFPIYSKIEGNKERLWRAFIKTQIVIIFLTLPFAGIFIFFPSEIVNLVLGRNWVSVVPILPILAVFSAVRTISGSASALFLAVNKQEYVTISMGASFCGLVITIVPLVLNYGLIGAAISALFGALISVPFFIFYIIKIFKTKI